MASASLVIAYHADDVEVLAWIYLIIRLWLSCLVDDALADIGKHLSGNRIGNRTVSWRLLEADGIIQPRKVSRAGDHLELLKIERLDLANQRILIL